MRRGPRDLTRALSQALEAAQRDQDVVSTLTHPLHTYPARMHPATVRRLLDVVLGGTIGRGADGVLIDPFCGSGTTLVEGCHAGLRAIGVDANPLAVSIARAKTWTGSRSRLRALREAGHRIAASALAEGKAARRSGYESPPERSPGGVDAAWRNRRLLPWFAPHVRRELEHMAGLIDEMREPDAALADVLTVILSSLLYKVSRRASDTDATRVERRIGRGASARLFQERTDLLVTGLSEMSRSSRSPAGEVHCGDARDLSAAGLSPGVGDAVITSPPYAGTYQYTENQRLRLDFLGMDPRAFHAAELGSRSHFPLDDGGKRRRARRRYVRALSATIEQMALMCRPRALMALMLGDSVAGDRAMWAEDIIDKALPERVELLAFAGQARPLLGMRERDAFEGRPKREYIFLLHRVGDPSPGAIARSPAASAASRDR